MTIATDILQRYLDAETAILAGQTVRFRDAAGNDMTVTHANLIEIQQGRREWQRRVAGEQQQAAGGGTIRYQIPDFSR